MAEMGALLSAMESRVGDIRNPLDRSLPRSIVDTLSDLSLNAVVLGTLRSLSLQEAGAGPSVWMEAADRLFRGGCSPADFLKLTRAVLGALRATADATAFPAEDRAGVSSRLELYFDAVERGGMARWAGVLEETAARLRQTEEQLAQAQRMEAIGRLTGGIAHDFNNLLTGILGYASLLKTFLPEGSDGYGAASYIERSARRASELTRQLLAYSRRETPKLRPVEIRRVIEEAVGILSRSVNKNVEIRTDFQAPPETVMGDSGALVQAFLNLGVNAGDAMPGGGILTFSTTPFVSDGMVYVNDVLVPEGRYISACVSDTGSGIPEAIREQVFAPFFTTKAPGEGTGLGLSMVYSCVRTHCGFIGMESREGAGTRFRILLPIAEDRAEPLVSREPEHVPQGRETILVIDDEDIPLHLLCDMLRSLGYTPLPATSGEEGIEILTSAPGKVDLVILDKIMPGMDGAETLRRLRGIRRGLRVILCSGHAAEGTSGARVSGEFNDFLQKPYERETLARKVRSVLDNKASRI